MGFIKEFKMMKNIVDLRPERVTENKCTPDEFLQDLAKGLYQGLDGLSDSIRLVKRESEGLNNSEEIKKTNEAVTAILNGDEEGWERSLLKVNHYLYCKCPEMYVASRAEFTAECIATIRTFDILKKQGYDIMTPEEALRRMNTIPSFRKAVEKHAKIFNFNIVSDETFTELIPLIRNISASDYKHGCAFTEDYLYIYEDGTIEENPYKQLKEYNFDKVAFLFED